MLKKKIIAVVGPTASGKTSLGVEIAKRFGGEVISADSMQIYKGMDIATAKPSESEMQGIPHHLLGFVNVGETYSAARFRDDANSSAADIISRGRLPVLVGGTGLYIDTFLKNTSFFPQPEDMTVRKELALQMEKLGAAAMLERLRQVDPERAAVLHPNNTVRILRALEVYILTGSTITEQEKLSHIEESPYKAYKIGISFPDREVLYKRINDRVDLMLEAGLVNEAKAFYQASPRGTAVAAIGYKELYPYIAGEDSLSECAERLKRETRRYAKRQITWFKRDEGIHWYDYSEDFSKSCSDIFSGIELFLKEEAD